MAIRPDAILIDAHNLIHADSALHRRARNDLDAARRDLLHRLPPRSRYRVFIDGGPGGHTRTTMHGPIIVDWSGARSADDRIVAWIQAHTATRYLVITDDRALATRSRAFGARIQSCRHFLADLNCTHSSPDDDRGPPPPDEVAYWVRVFGG